VLPAQVNVNAVTIASLESCQPAHPVGLRRQQACDDEVENEGDEPRGYLRHCVPVPPMSSKKCLDGGGGGGLDG